MVGRFLSLLSPFWHADTYRRFLWLLTGGSYGGGFLLFPLLNERLGIPLLAALALAMLLLIVPPSLQRWREHERRWANRILGTSFLPPARDETRERFRDGAREFATDMVYFRALLWVVFRAIFGLLPLLLVGLIVVGVGLNFYSLLTSPGSWLLFGLGPVLLTASTVALLLLAIYYARFVADEVLRGFAESWLGAPPSEQIESLLENNDTLIERSMLLDQRDTLANHLYDSMGQAMTATMLRAATARRKLRDDPQYVVRALEDIEDSARRVLKGLDHTLGVLHNEDDRPVDYLDRDEPEGFFEALRLLDVPLFMVGTEDLVGTPHSQQKQVWRVIREGCINVIRHAGPAPIQVRVVVREEQVEIVVANDPPETALTPDGTLEGQRGQRHIADRVGTLGGSFKAGATEDGSYRLDVVLPLRTIRK